MSTQTAIGSSAVPSRKSPPSGRLAGAAGLIFAATLVVDNLIRASAPGQGASPPRSPSTSCTTGSPRSYRWA